MKVPIKPEDDFLGYKEPMGTIISIFPPDTIRKRLARAFFNQQLFIYFESLSSGQTGWGISYVDWLRGHGWSLIDHKTFERKLGIMEELEKRE